MTAIPAQAHSPFFGPVVVRGAFVLAVFGWGIGFYGPSVYLHAVALRTGWPLALVSSAVTMHFVVGALVITQLPRWHQRFGVGPTAVVGAALTSVGLLGWATAAQPWQLFAATLPSGAGWVTMGAVAVNAVIAPWYVRLRPVALARAYNGASIGGVIFSPLWVWLIASLGFATAAALVGLVTMAVMAALARAVFARSPERLGQWPDGDLPGTTARVVAFEPSRRLHGRALWRDRRFLTLAAGMALGLFAQIGLVAHLFSLLAPVMGAQSAGLTMGFATACAIAGRTIVARVMPHGVDRRHVAAAAYLVQLAGSLVLLAASGQSVGLIVLGVALFGSGIGNATSLPPLIAQAEFAPQDVACVIALIVALGQATYAFAPAVFGFVLAASGAGAAQVGHGAGAFFLSVMLIQCAAIACFVDGRSRAGRAR